MFRLWGKIIKNNRILVDQVFELSSSNSNLKDMTTEAMESICYNFDIQTPLWFKGNEKDFDLIGKTRFTDDNFVEDLEFDYLEIEIIENK